MFADCRINRPGLSLYRYIVRIILFREPGRRPCEADADPHRAKIGNASVKIGNMTLIFAQICQTISKILRQSQSSDQKGGPINGGAIALTLAVWRRCLPGWKSPYVLPVQPLDERESEGGGRRRLAVEIRARCEQPMRPALLTAR